jgi:hypothetical protein
MELLDFLPKMDALRREPGTRPNRTLFPDLLVTEDGVVWVNHTIPVERSKLHGTDVATKSDRGRIAHIGQSRHP